MFYVTMYMQTIADRIRELRVKAKFSQRELGQKIGVTGVTISKWEQEINKPKSKSLLKLCQVFDVDIDWLLFGRKQLVTLGVQQLDDGELFKVPFFENFEAAIESTGSIAFEKATSTLVIPKSFLPQALSKELVALRVKGDSMELNLKQIQLFALTETPLKSLKEKFT